MDIPDDVVEFENDEVQLTRTANGWVGAFVQFPDRAWDPERHSTPEENFKTARNIQRKPHERAVEQVPPSYEAFQAAWRRARRVDPAAALVLAERFNHGTKHETCAAGIAALDALQPEPIGVADQEWLRRNPRLNQGSRADDATTDSDSGKAPLRPLPKPERHDPWQGYTVVAHDTSKRPERPAGPYGIVAPEDRRLGAGFGAAAVGE